MGTWLSHQLDATTWSETSKFFFLDNSGPHSVCSTTHGVQAGRCRQAQAQSAMSREFLAWEAVTWMAESIDAHQNLCPDHVCPRPPGRYLSVLFCSLFLFTALSRTPHSRRPYQVMSSFFHRPLRLTCSSIRNRLTALKNRSECIRASDVNTLYRDVVKQGAHQIRLLCFSSLRPWLSPLLTQQLTFNPLSPMPLPGYSDQAQRCPGCQYNV